MKKPAAVQAAVQAAAAMRAPPAADPSGAASAAWDGRPEAAGGHARGRAGEPPGTDPRGITADLPR